MNDKLNKILVNEIVRSDIFKGYLVKDIAGKLPSISDECVLIRESDDNYEFCLKTIKRFGKMVYESKEEQVLSALVSGGINNMNPCLLVIEVEERTINIMAVAKEGIFNQHTASKVIKMIYDLLNK